MRPSQREHNQLRPVELIPGFAKHAEGSCLIKMGETHVLCTASVDTKVPPWLKGTGKGWITAEYGMLPRSTHERMDREAAKGKQSGRTQEIQRLVGRALRAGVDLTKLGEMQIKVDCDVIQADGGTRCASITGGFVALRAAIDRMLRVGALPQDPILENVAAVSCGIVAVVSILDLEYEEDSKAEADCNIIMTSRGGLIEVQATAEDIAFPRAQLDELIDLADKGIKELIQAQNNVRAI